MSLSKEKSATKRTIFISVIACLSLTACSTKKVSKSLEPPPFDRSEFTDVTPTVDGSAYATSSDSRLWYLRGNEAVRVSVVGDASEKLPESFEIVPLLDGSAYLAATLSEAGLWHLRGERAEKVREVLSLTSAGERVRTPDSAFYSLYLAEHKKRKQAEERANNPPERTEDF